MMMMKIFAKNKKRIIILIQTIRIYNQDVGMDFENENCAILIMKKGKPETTEGIELPNQENIKELGEK